MKKAVAGRVLAYTTFLSVCLVLAMVAGGPAEAQAQDVTLRFQRPGRFDVVERVFRPITDRFEEQTGAAVDFVDMGWDEYFERLPLMLATGRTPDVMLNQQGGLFPYGAEGMWLPLNDYIDDELRGQLVPGLLEAVTWGDDILAIPASVGSYVLWYRPDIFEQAGLDPNRPPDTWAELLEYAETIRAEVGIPGLGLHGKPGVDLADTFAYFYHTATGRPLWDANLNQIDLRDPGAAEALRFMRQLVESPGTQDHVEQYDRPDLRSLLRDGQIAMMFDGPWIMNVIQAQLADGSILAGPVPAGPAGRHSIIVVDAWAIPAHTQHPDEAWRLLRFLVEPENQAAHDTGYGSIPPQYSVAERPEFQTQYFEALVDGLTHGFSSRVASPRYTEVNQRLPENVQSVLIGRASPEEALQNLARQLGWNY